MQRMLAEHPDIVGETDVIDEDRLDPYLSMAYAPEPDLFIRTGGEQRISNFLVWQLAYTELYFTDCFWPAFDARELDLALAWYAGRERRFGRTSEQIRSEERLAGKECASTFKSRWSTYI